MRILRFHNLLFLLLMGILPLYLEAKQLKNPSVNSIHPSSSLLGGWKKNQFLQLSPRSYAKTCILILVPTVYGNNFIGKRWLMGKRVWESYMNSHPDVDCYFIVCADPKEGKEGVWVEGNTIYVGDRIFQQTKRDRLLYKTIKAMEHFQGHYTHYIRTNVNTFFDLQAVANFSETHSRSFYSTPLWEKAWFTIGYAIVCTADVASHMVKEYHRLDRLGEDCISSEHADDAVLTSLATGINPFLPNRRESENPFICCPSLKLGCRQLLCKKSLKTKRFSKYGLLLSPLNSLQEGIDAFDQAGDEVMLVRTRDGLNLEELTKLYQHMFSKTYPSLHLDLRDI